MKTGEIRVEKDEYKASTYQRTAETNYAGLEYEDETVIHDYLDWLRGFEYDDNEDTRKTDILGVGDDKEIEVEMGHGIGKYKEKDEYEIYLHELRNLVPDNKIGYETDDLENAKKDETNSVKDEFWTFKPIRTEILNLDYYQELEEMNYVDEVYEIYNFENYY
ncbi:24392_t:CDS:2 [Dentiscutata erythropus]|uniref:24392_t:CDS:1 n=1 Tax=Dentiscutata erythropus TaxID=1348616 RepID=A0A9N9D7G5_9GLOM|nr:24392_t:CDS:2 [Dentiscutata erythropus]